MQLLSLQQGRGLAAMAVVAFHLSLLLGNSRYLNDAVFLNFTHRGNLGVDFFFVLSGFIILYAHHKDINHLNHVSDYLLKRFIRLFPVYWLYTAIFCSLVALGFGSAGIIPQTARNWVAAIFLIRLDSFELPITPAWTLIHEVAFYLVFATLILNRAFGLIVLSMWLIIGGFIFQYADEGSRSPLTTYFSPLNFNFVIGMAAFYAFQKLSTINLKPALPAGLVLFVLIYISESHGVGYNYLQIAYAISFGLLILGAVSYEKSGFKTEKLKIFSLIGNASYTIYLTHLAFLGLLSKIIIRLRTY
ncbi:acyltransferase family protein [Pseudochrobactrum sp. HB0163]|uniref:acyltransferase family protein n=1 Tax=Pseudochrobactrum sp. HB0163 TaxID=3450708 RepID=UPI003F6DDE23